MTSPDRVVYAPDGTVIGAWRSGNGPPMVLVHGSADDHTAWDLVAPRLAMRFEVYAVDRRGRGASPWSGPVYMIEQEFDDIAAFVDSTGTPTWLFGHGYGADVAIGAALRTRNLAGLILYEPAPGIPTVGPAILVEAERRIGDGDPDGALTLMLSSVLELDDQAVTDLRAHPGWAASVAMVDTMPRELRAEEAWQPSGYNDLVLPTLLLVGSTSPDWARRWTSMAQSAVPNSRLLELAGQGHLALMTAPDRVAGAVTDFVFDPSRS
jgi:pimeloyl-ACP methyl ester carboxylesterase